MKITMIGRKVTLRDNFKERVEKKLSKFNRMFDENADAKVTVTVERNHQTVEVTIRNGGMVYRAESSAKEMNEALDAVVDVLGGQIRKNKCRLEKKLRSGALNEFLAADEGAEPEEEVYQVVRTKRFPVKGKRTVKVADIEIIMGKRKLHNHIPPDNIVVVILYHVSAQNTIGLDDFCLHCRRAML